MEGDDNIKQGRPGMLRKGGGAFFPSIPTSSGVFPEEVTSGPALHACG